MVDHREYNDQELLALLKRDAETGFAEIYRRFWKMLLNSAYKRLNSIEEAEELVQELFINLFVRRDEMQINGNLEVFLKNALKYRILNVYRSRYTREQYAMLVLKENRINTIDPEQHLQAKELAQKIKLATQKLPEKCREVFILSKVERLSNKTIAAQLGISVSTVEKHISKGMKIMKDDFSGYSHTFIVVLMIIFTK